MNDYGIEPQKITIVGGGVNFNPLPKLVSRSTNEVTTALFFGKEFHRKGGDILLQAFGQARRILDGCRLLMITNGPISASLPLDGVEVIEPTWDRQKIAAFYAEADFFVLPSRLETWGDVFLEAMAYSLPCIGIDDDAMGDIILDNQTGTLVPGDDVPALTQAMVKLFTDPSCRQAWGAAGRRRAEEYFTWDKVVDRLAPIIIDASVTRSSNTVQEEYR
jgi:glycosyltransferase involved in cell wall biosynthesis